MFLMASEGFRSCIVAWDWCWRFPATMTATDSRLLFLILDSEDRKWGRR
jgi:hypothetical protein